MAVAEDRARAACQDGCHPLPLDAQAAVANLDNGSMRAVPASLGYLEVDDVLRIPELAQLIHTHDLVLREGKPGET